MTDSSALPSSQSRPMPVTRSIRVMQAVVLVLLGLKLWFDIAVPPMGDETYYWMWGQRPELS